MSAIPPLQPSLPPLPSQTVAHNCSPFHQRNPYPVGSTSALVSTYLSFPQPAGNPPWGNGCMNNPHFFNPPDQNNRYRYPSLHRNNPRMSDTVHFPSFCCSETSPDCPFHEHGWLGLPGRPIISLVECLLEAAAQKVEESTKNATTASEYIHLALKVSKLLLTLFLLAGVTQKARRVLVVCGGRFLGRPLFLDRE